MNLARLGAISGLLLSAFLATGCEIETEKLLNDDIRPASTVVINEVFTLPPGHPTFFSWIELLNPTRDTVDLSGWTLSYPTARYTQSIRLQLDTATFTLRPNSFPVFTESLDGVDVYDVPFAESFLEVPGVGVFPVPTPLPPGQMFTMISDSNRFDDHMVMGPGPGIDRFRAIIRTPAYEVIPGAIVDTFYQVFVVNSKVFRFSLPHSGQILLKDTTGSVVDVVRYGNYVYPGPGSDPYPGNISLGIIPEFESIARYALGYFTRNTANDFYVTKANIRPTPHAANPRIKQLNQ